MKTSHSVTEIFLHVAFACKRREPYELSEIEGLIFDFSSLPNYVKILKWNFGGSERFDDFNHIHFLIEVNSHVQFPELIRQLKVLTSKQLKKYIKFHGWQIGYFIKSVGSNSIKKVKKYIENQ